MGSVFRAIRGLLTSELDEQDSPRRETDSYQRFN